VYQIILGVVLPYLSAGKHLAILERGHGRYCSRLARIFGQSPKAIRFPHLAYDSLICQTLPYSLRNSLGRHLGRVCDCNLALINGGFNQLGKVMEDFL
jgi:hypothetical protein